MNKNIFLCANLILFLCVSGSTAQQMIDGIAAVVGNEIVLKSEVDQYVQSYVIQNKINIRNDSEKMKKLEKEILERLIEQKIMLTKADEDTIVADERDVDRRVEEQVRYLIQQVGSEEKLEAAFQSPIKQIRRDLRVEIADRLKVEMLRRNKFQNVKITRREVENFFETYRDSLPPMQETVDISHILMQVKPGAESQSAALEKIRAIKDRLAAGEEFGELATKYSEDPASAQREGDLGFTKRGDFVQEFEEVAFGLEPEQVSDVVQTQFGYHIIKLIERRGEQIRTSHILIRLTPTEEDEKNVIDKLNELRQEILNGANFDSMAVLYSDDENVREDHGHLGIWEVNKLAIPAFKSVVGTLEPGDISEPFKTEYGYHILKLNDHKASRQLTLEDDWEQIQQIALNYKMEQEYSKWIKEIKKDIPIEYRIEMN
jgi:peptidyl-prolyl cis-trans isomerase SurA